jgi:hypothetical protein
LNERPIFFVYQKYFNGINFIFFKGITLVQVEKLNLLKLAPGGHVGRFCIWTESAFKRLDDIYGTWKNKSSVKKDFKYVRIFFGFASCKQSQNDDIFETR